VPAVVSWLAVPNVTVTLADPCCQEKLLWGDEVLMVLYAMLAFWVALCSLASMETWQAALFTSVCP
jgi:hypothetical protein